MLDDESLLGRRLPPRLPPEMRLAGDGRRIGDGLVHEAWIGLHKARLREYAPCGVVARAEDGSLTPKEGFERAWREGCMRFLEQAERLRGAALPGVATIWEVGDLARGAWLIAAPPGEPLAVPLAAGLSIPPDEVIRIAKELAEALARVHAIGLTHLQISPETVSLADGCVVLSDLGVDNRAFLPLLQSDAGLIRPGFSAIEMYDGARTERLGGATDVHAACALVYRLVTGADPRPWQQRWREAAREEIPNAADYPPAFIAAIRRGLAIEAENRFSDAAAWREAMEGGPASAPAPPPGGDPYVWQQQHGVHGDPMDRYVPMEPAGAGGGGKILVHALLASLALLLFAGGIWLWRGRAPAAEEQIAAASYTVTGPANVRSGPTPGAEVVGRLKAGDRVTGIMEDAGGDQRWLRLTEGPNSGAYIWARNLAVPEAAAAAAGAPAARPPQPAEPPPLDLSARFSYDDDAQCKFHPQIDAALENMVDYGSGSGSATARPVTIGAMRLTPVVTTRRHSMSGGEFYYETDAVLSFPRPVRWNGLTLRSMVLNSGYESGESGLVFAEDAATVQRRLAAMNVALPLPPGILDLPTEGCSADIRLRPQGGGTALICGGGC